MSSTESEIQMENIGEQFTEYYFVNPEDVLEDFAPCDVTLKAKDGGLVHAHKSVLSTKCEYFDNLFIENYEENNVFNFEELSFMVLKRLINYIYTQEMPFINELNVEEMLRGAEMFYLNEVGIECVDILLDPFHEDNCLGIKNNKKPWRRSYAEKNFKLVANSSGFLKKNIKYISKLIQSSWLLAQQEQDVYDAIIKWIKYDEKNRKKFLPELLCKVKLVLIPHEYLTEILNDPLIKEDSECKNLVEDARRHFILRNPRMSDFEGPISMPGVEQLKIFQQNEDESPSKSLLPRYKCVETDSPCYGKVAINIASTLNEMLSEEFQSIEWIQAMDETNFLNNWDEQWKDLKP
uniref:Kelch-like protein 2 n=1 Tax=Sipha flava TaxID=143950 RepID=A0A2S2QY22_9HEMI